MLHATTDKLENKYIVSIRNNVSTCIGNNVAKSLNDCDLSEH